MNSVTDENFGGNFKIVFLKPDEYFIKQATNNICGLKNCSAIRTLKFLLYSMFSSVCQ